MLLFLFQYRSQWDTTIVVIYGATFFILKNDLYVFVHCNANHVQTLQQKCKCRFEYGQCMDAIWLMQSVSHNEKPSPLFSCRTGLRVTDGETNLVPYHQDDDENEDWGHYYPSDDDDHCPAEKLRLHKMTPHVLWLGGELHTAHHAGCCQRGDDVIVDGQHTEVVLGPCCQVVDQKVLAWWGDHSVDEKGEEGKRKRKCYSPWAMTI